MNQDSYFVGAILKHEKKVMVGDFLNESAEKTCDIVIPYKCFDEVPPVHSFIVLRLSVGGPKKFQQGARLLTDEELEFMETIPPSEMGIWMKTLDVKLTV